MQSMYYIGLDVHKKTVSDIDYRLFSTMDSSVTVRYVPGPNFDRYSFPR
jgi:hypothetical protein